MKIMKLHDIDPDDSRIELQSKERNALLWGPGLTFLVTSAWIIYHFFTTLLEQAKSNTVAATLSFSQGEPSALTTINGSAVHVTGQTSLSIPNDAVTEWTRTTLRVAAMTQVFSYLLLIAVLTTVFVLFVKGRMFERVTKRLLVASAVVGLIVVPAARIPSIIGGNLAIRDLGWRGQTGIEATVVDAQMVYIYLFYAAVLTMVALSGIGSRMARDQHGLV